MNKLRILLSIVLCYVLTPTSVSAQDNGLNPVYKVQLTDITYQKDETKKKVTVGKVLGVVADVDGDAGLLQVLRLVGLGAVGAGDLVAGLLQKQREPGHGAAPDADEVRALVLIVKFISGHDEPSRRHGGAAESRLPALDIYI